MLLIWLLIPAASAMMDCGRACDLCETSSNPLTRLNSCSFCKECVLTVKRRMMVEGDVLLPSNGSMYMKGKVLSDQQMKQLKYLEKKEFIQMMKDYGWKPQDFLEDGEVNDEDCTPPKMCLYDSDENKEQPNDDVEKLINVPPPKTQKTSTECPPQIVCPPMPQIVCPPYCLSTTVATSSFSCPPVIPCDERDKLSGQLARLEAAEAEAMGCPPQPICSDEENYQERLRKSSTRALQTRRSTRFKSTNKTPNHSKANCLACVPPCPLPCPLYPAFPPPIPIPYPLPQALQALMTLTTAIPQKKEKKTPIDNDKDSDFKEQGKMPLKEEDTTIIYVKIIKDEPKLRRG